MALHCPNKSSALYKALLKLNNNNDNLTTYQYDYVYKLQDDGLLSLKRFAPESGKLEYTIPKVVDENSIAKSFRGESPYAKNVRAFEELDKRITLDDIDWIKIKETKNAYIVEIVPRYNKPGTQGMLFQLNSYDTQVKYQFKSAEKILANLSKIKQWEKVITNSSIIWEKIQKDLQIPKEQLELIKNSEGESIEQKIANFLANYSYIVEINTAKSYKDPESITESFARDGNFNYSRDISYQTGEYIYKKTDVTKSYLQSDKTYYNGEIITKEEFDKALKKYNEAPNSKYYSNITVPGGTNYTENEISIPGQLIEEKPQGVPVKEGVSELFESNPELANAVYEAAGYKSKYKDAAGIGNLIDELKEIKEPYLKELADLFISLNIDIPLYYSKSQEYAFIVPDNTIIIPKNSYGIIKQKSIIHELLHGGTSNKLLSNPNFKSEIESLIKTIKDSDQQGSLTFSYELQSADELISGLSEKSFVNFLKQKGIYDNVLSVVKNNLEFKKGFQVTPQQKQQAQQLYSQYLDTIFPDSPNKKILYHVGGKNITKFDKNMFGKGEGTNASGLGVYFQENPYEIMNGGLGSDYFYESPTPIKSMLEDGILTLAIANIKPEDKFDKNLNVPQEIVIRDVDRIHILGSKQDIQGFKNWINNNTKTVRKGAITPSIKGHAQFSTDNGIGWFRSDDKHPFTGFLEDLIASGTIKKVPCG